MNNSPRARRKTAAVPKTGTWPAAKIQRLLRTRRGTEEATGSKQHLVNLHDMGTLGSRDNRAGGSGEHMERESTGDAIEQ